MQPSSHYWGYARRAGPLIDYEDAAFVRSGEASAVDLRDGWLFYDLSTPWPGTDVARILPDGAILIEGSRTNSIPHSENIATGLWTRNVSIVTGLSAPDGASDACALNPDAAAPDRVFAGAAPATPYSVTAYVKRVVGTTMKVRGPGNYPANTDVSPASTAWQRTATVVRTSDINQVWWPHAGDEVSGSGTVGETVGLWGCQAEAGAFATSIIRTDGAAVTRGNEFATLASGLIPSSLKTGRWTVPLWAEWATSSAPGTAYPYYFDANNYLAIVGGNTLRCRAGGSNFDVSGLTFTALARRDVTIDFVGNTLEIDGASPVALTNDWSGAAGDLSIGSDGTGNHFYGVIGRPQAA